ncbi:MAG: hypothetical protein V1760_02270, partial [Candidatus Peregrinibacteria bacterium]
MKHLLNIFRVGYFLAWRQIKRSSRWTTALIIFVMTLTFLNLVVVSGVLVGLIAGAGEAYRKQYAGDILISALQQKAYIEQSQSILKNIEHYPEIEAITPRYIKSGTIEA